MFANPFGCKCSGYQQRCACRKANPYYGMLMANPRAVVRVPLVPRRGGRGVLVDLTSMRPTTMQGAVVGQGGVRQFDRREWRVAL
jgi:hypothetical protein